LEPLMKDTMNQTDAPGAQNEAPKGVDGEAKRPTSAQAPKGMDAESSHGSEELEDIAPEREERVPSTNSYG